MITPPLLLPPALPGRPVPFPDPESADPEGVVAVGGDLSVETLVSAYSQGIFPWCGEPPIWYSPDPRGVFDLDRFHVGRSMRRVLRKHEYEVTFDRGFDRVIGCCARLHGETWIDAALRRAYLRLHRAGFAHSVEVWEGTQLVGGVYGVAVGGLFAGESMFHRRTNASKIALCHLRDRLVERGFVLFDIQMTTPATEILGAHSISRTEYLARLKQAMKVRTSLIDRHE